VSLEGTEAGAVLREADLAMYAAKASGGARWQVFAPALLETLTDEVARKAMFSAHA
jgi:hypothetical protein